MQRKGKYFLPHNPLADLGYGFACWSSPEARACVWLGGYLDDRNTIAAGRHCMVFGCIARTNASPVELAR